MREIKFRAWDKKEQRFNEYLRMTLDGDRVEEDDYGNSPNLKEDVILSQFTGLLDKNGKEIYEGDIVRYKVLGGFDCGWDDGDTFIRDSEKCTISTATVKFKNGNFSPREESHLIEDGYYSWRTFDFEVIGNVHENPELLK